MVHHLDRKISSITMHKMLSWSHFLFHQQLKHKAKEHDCTIHEVLEHYTSKTCGHCARIHWKLGDNKVFRCPFCHFRIDRNWNGARNIFLMNLEKCVGVASPRVS